MFQPSVRHGYSKIEDHLVIRLHATLAARLAALWEAWTIGRPHPQALSAAPRRTKIARRTKSALRGILVAKLWSEFHVTIAQFMHDLLPSDTTTSAPHFMLEEAVHPKWIRGCCTVDWVCCTSLHMRTSMRINLTIRSNASQTHDMAGSFWTCTSTNLSFGVLLLQKWISR